jgi:hypothetical protein
MTEATEMLFSKLEAELGPQAVDGFVEWLKQLRSRKT